MKLKIKPEHMASLERYYLVGKPLMPPGGNAMSQRWGAIRKAGVFKGELFDELYGYLDDSHIGNALKRIQQAHEKEKAA